jgi:hypothetical protein
MFAELQGVAFIVDYRLNENVEEQIFIKDMKYRPSP